MRLAPRLLAAAIVASLLVGSIAQAASAKKYQVTGTVTELTDTLVVVTKADGERWELSRDKSIATDGELKVGQKVTIQYVMVVASVESKGAATTKPAR
jgi:ribosomal protein S1